jgi:predicted Zn-dependent protease
MESTIEYKKEQSQIIARLFKEKQWREASNLVAKLLKQEPGDHWLQTQIAEIFYFEKQYDEALGYVETALKIAPRCPLVLWDYARILDNLKRYTEAIQVLKSLIRRGATNIAYGACGEGIREARKLVNDCRYRLGLAYASTGDFSIASKYIKMHIVNRNRNCSSIYNLREVKKDYALILEGKDPRKV